MTELPTNEMRKMPVGDHWGVWQESKFIPNVEGLHIVVRLRSKFPLPPGPLFVTVVVQRGPYRQHALRDVDISKIDVWRHVTKEDKDLGQLHNTYLVVEQDRQMRELGNDERTG